MTDMNIAIPASVVTLAVTQIALAYFKSRNGNGNATQYEVKQIAENQKHCMDCLDTLKQSTTREVDLLTDIKDLLGRSNR